MLQLGQQNIFKGDNNMKKSLFILALTGALLGGCTALEKTNEAAEKVSSVTKTAQTMLDINSIKGVEYTLENSDITITFDSNKVYGFSGVNRYFGGVQVEGDKITISNIASTMMAGPQSKMTEESEYLKTLALVNKMTIEENGITLTGEKVLKFIKK